MASPYIDTDDLSTFLGIDANTTKGTAIVSAACGAVRAYTGQTLTAGTATVYIDGSGTDVLHLPENPINAAGTVIESGGTLTLDSDYKVTEEALYRIPGTVTPDGDWCWLRDYWWPGRQNVAVTYEYGYDSVPEELKQVTILIAARLYNQPATGGIAFQSLGEYSVRYDSAGSDLTRVERDLLRIYKRAR